MSRFFALLRYQIKVLFISPSTYAAAFLFTVLMGGIYLLSFIDVSSSGGGKSPIDMFLQLFWFPVLFMVPMLTMRSIAEDRRMGTLQALMTTPVTAFDVVLAKFLACYLLYIFFWLLTLFFPVITVLTLPETGVDDRVFSVSQIVLGYLFIFVSGAMYIAIGIFASSLTRTTLVAGMLSFCMLFITLTGSAIAYKFVLSDPSWGVALESLTDYLQTFRHLDDFGKAVLDTRPFFLYFSSAAAFIAATVLITDYKEAS